MGEKETKQKNSKISAVEEAALEVERAVGKAKKAAARKTTEKPTDESKSASKSTSKSTAKSSTNKTSAVAKVSPRLPIKSTRKKSTRRTPRHKLTEAEVIDKKAESEIKNTPKTTKSAKTTKSNPKPTRQVTKSAKMKLPLIRRIHIKIRYVVALILILAIAGFCGRVALWEESYLAAMNGSTRHVVETPEEEVYEGEDTDTSKPTNNEVAEWHVATDKVRYLSIPSLGIRNARVQDVGLTAQNAIDTPKNIYNVGWYTKSALPGKNGVSIFDAHGGDLGNGIFKKLPRIAKGDDIEIEMGDEKTVYVYRVSDFATKKIGNEANEYMKTAFASPKSGTASLSLITCTGDWYQASQTYSHRFFVRALLVETRTK